MSAVRVLLKLLELFVAPISLQLMIWPALTFVTREASLPRDLRSGKHKLVSAAALALENSVVRRASERLQGN